MDGKARTPIASVAAIALAVVLASCGPRGTPEVAGGVTLLRFGILNGSPAGLLRGRITFANGCASVEDAQGVPVTGMWSPGTRLDTSTGVLRIVIAGIPFDEGDEVSMGGGEYSDAAFAESLVGPIPEPCRGDRYWLLNELADT